MAPRSPDFRPNYPGGSGELSDHLPLPSSISLERISLPRELRITKQDVQAIIIGFGVGGLTGNIGRRQAITVPALVTAGYLGAEMTFDNLRLGVFIDNKIEKLGQALRYGIDKVADVPEGLKREAKRFLSSFENSFFVQFLGDLTVNQRLKPDRCAVVSNGEDGLFAVQAKDQRGANRIFLSGRANGGTVYRLETPPGKEFRLGSFNEATSGIIVSLDSQGNVLKVEPSAGGSRPEIGAGVVVSDTTKIYRVFLPLNLRNWSGLPEPTPTPTPPEPTPTPERPFPALQVEGRYITFMKEQEKIYTEFKGGSVYSFFNGSYKFNEKTKYYIDLARQWGSNCIRLPLDIGQVNLDELKKAVDYIASQRTFCLLCPGVINGVGFQNPTYQESEFNQLLTFTDILVRKFQDKTNVMYQLTGEPGPVEVEPGDWRFVTWEEWAPWARNLATAIRNVRSDVLIGLPGIDWGRNFADFKDHPELFPFDNFFCTVDYYRWFLNPGTPQETEIIRDPDEWLCMKGIRPIFFTEIGVPDHMGGRDHWADDDAVRFILEKVEGNPYEFHVVAFEFAPKDWRTSVVIDASGTPSSRGQPYHDNYLDLSSTCPPTPFP